MTMFRAAVVSWLLAAGLMAAVVGVVKINQPVRIMFDPATDGPIKVERVPIVAMSTSGMTGGMCLTMVSIDSGRSQMPVATPCTAGTTSSWTTITGTGTTR